jgi:hypothetical protein
MLSLDSTLLLASSTQLLSNSRLLSADSCLLLGDSSLLSTDSTQLSSGSCLLWSDSNQLLADSCVLGSNSSQRSGESIQKPLGALRKSPIALCPARRANRDVASTNAVRRNPTGGHEFAAVALIKVVKFWRDVFVTRRVVGGSIHARSRFRQPVGEQKHMATITYFFYDDPLSVYDGIAVYDGVAVRRKTMRATVAYNLRNLSLVQTLAKIKKAHDAVLAAAASFTTPNPTLAALLVLYNTALAKVNALIAAEQQLLTLRTQAEQAVDDAVDGYRTLGTYVENVADGDPAIITLGGYDLAQERTAAQPMPKVEGNTLTDGDDDGTADAVWNRVIGAKSYEVQVSADPMSPTSWQHYATVTSSKLHITGQPAGKRWTRVRAVNKLGPGPWSDPACGNIS